MRAKGFPNEESEPDWFGHHRIAMIRNGLYVYRSKARDGVDGGADGVMILRDGAMLGGTDFFYFVGTYTCSNGKWKGEFTNDEHTPAPIMRPMARKGTVGIGFNGTYCDNAAQIDLTALVGNRSLQYSATFELLVAV
ncbi:hypothetical protein AB4Z51_38845 [Bradyrhizobium sp. 2TAF36]